MRLTLAILAGTLIAAGQSFDVASIKPHPRDNFNTAFNGGPGRITWAGIAVRGIMMTAYGIETDQIEGGPGWVYDDRYDLEAQVDGMSTMLTDEQLRPLVRNLLAERFDLKVHTEMREMSAYLLQEAPKGHKLQRSIGRRVVDGTSIPAEHDFTLEWTDTVRSETGVSITTAIQEQLGLRLVERKMPVEVYVIDTIRKPSDN